MKTVKFIKNFRQYKEGQRINASEPVSKLLEKMGVASYDTKMRKKTIHNVQKVINQNPNKGDDNSPVIIQEEKKKKKAGRPPKRDNTYQTTDMKAE